MHNQRFPKIILGIAAAAVIAVAFFAPTSQATTKPPIRKDGENCVLCHAVCDPPTRGNSPHEPVIIIVP